MGGDGVLEAGGGIQGRVSGARRGLICMHAFAAFNMYTCSIAPDWCMHPGPEVVVTAGARAGKEP